MQPGLVTGAAPNSTSSPAHSKLPTGEPLTIARQGPALAVTVGEGPAIEFNVEGSAELVSDAVATTVRIEADSAILLQNGGATRCPRVG